MDDLDVVCAGCGGRFPSIAINRSGGMLPRCRSCAAKTEGRRRHTAERKMNALKRGGRGNRSGSGKIYTAEEWLATVLKALASREGARGKAEEHE